MRLVSAILILLASIMSLGSGIALRTVWAGPDSIVKSVEIDHTAPAVLIDGKTLTAYPGRQTITAIDDQGDPEAGVVLVYGRSTDVIAWVTPARFTAVRHNQETGELYAVPRLGAESTLPSPLGSDLWLEQYRETDAVRTSLTADSGITVAVFADGERAAPKSIQISWPLDNISPLSGVLVALGIVAMAIGFVLLGLALTDVRRRRGPRRKITLAPKRRAPRRGPYGSRRGSTGSARSRRMTRSVVTMPLLGVLLAGGCVAPEAGQNSEGPAGGTPTGQSSDLAGPSEGASGDTDSATGAYPAVTQAQFERIMGRVANQVSLADQSLDAQLLTERFIEPSLSHRSSQYRLRSWDGELGQLVGIPAEPIRLLVPQQTSSWPRTVMAVIQEGPELNAPTIAVVLRQETPRENYQLSYSTLLAPDVILPPMPPADVGSPRLARDSKLVSLSPEETVSIYGDVLRRGPDSRGWLDFDTLTDDLYALVGPDGRDLRRESLGSELELSADILPTDYPVVALSTADNGALVFGTLEETEVVRPLEDGAAINATPSVRALTDLPSSTEGFVARYEMQIVWYVPPIGSDERARVVGYGYLLVDASELEPIED
ncbi:hypothetical protein C3B54_11615 [Pontimonas salivibrio]|uniref:DUF8094 domain-containing protein n=1 Tax=Pontimonas salivibrio TaxID=1159327 RepID=A0A2L2BPK2_9MICO|nr:hypothetical protein C3B54_11615 [Pontimonas salivibrio]